LKIITRIYLAGLALPGIPGSNQSGISSECWRLSNVVMALVSATLIDDSPNICGLLFQEGASSLKVLLKLMVVRYGLKIIAMEKVLPFILPFH
jgi:hypothetical protein